MHRTLVLGGASLVLLVTLGCADEPDACATRTVRADVDCSTTRDCVNAGYQGLTCVNGSCRKVCTDDESCRPSSWNDEVSRDTVPVCDGDEDLLDNAICEGQLCQLGCPNVACESDEQCMDGRCVFFADGFEPREGSSVASLSQFGWNSLSTELRNVDTDIAFEGEEGCVLGDELCAGPAGEGEYFVTIERTMTQPKGTATTEPTCRSCACCLQCLLEPDDGAPVDLEVCPSSRPSPYACPTSTPARCDAVCTQCNDCPDADASRIGERLVSCEEPPAQKACPSCLSCQTDQTACAASSCPSCASAPNSDECLQCVRDNCLDLPSCLSCRVCDEARDCLLTAPDLAECAEKQELCRALGTNGCFPAAVSYARSQLTDVEQALVSPEIDIGGASGEIVLEFLQVSFGIGETYRPGVQGVDPQEWEEAPQQVRVEFCGGDCMDESNWRPGKLRDGTDLVVPALDRRSNGLGLGVQSALDWREGLRQVVIPETLRTSTLRVRFVPELAEDLRLGLDAIRVRRLR